MRGIQKAAGAGLALLLAGCTSVEDPSGANDPYESFNREVFDFNHHVDKVVIKPVAEAYVQAVPVPLRDSLHNFFVNIDLPITFANDILQGELERGSETFLRFTVNSTIGLG